MRAASLGSGAVRSAAATRPMPQAFAPARERARRHLVSVVFVIYLLLIFEGSIRKWLLPGWSQYIFFIRDPFLLYAYLYAAHRGLWPKRSPLLGLVVAIGAFGVVLGVLQLVTSGAGQTAAMLAVYGWRNYFLYAPLALLIGAQFSTEDLLRVCRWTLLLCVPIGLLVALQFFSPLNSPLNVGIAEEAALQFVGLTTTSEHTRPMGTFSSGAGQNQFVASAFALLLAVLIMLPRERRTGRLVLLLGAGGLATALALSGSRGAFMQCGLIAVIGMGGLALFGRTAAAKTRSILLPLLLGAAFVVLYPLAFPEGLEAFTQRWELAATAEQRVFEWGVFGRALYGFVDFFRLLTSTPLLGYGLGMGGNASMTLDVGPEVWAETDWARHMVDLGPVFGTGYILLRIALTVWLGALVLRATRRGAGPLPLLLFAFSGYLLLLGQVTGQGAVHGYAWLFMGFTIAAAAARPAPAGRLRTRQRAML